MSEWISVDDELPPTFGNSKSIWLLSKSYPVKIEGLKGWSKAHLAEHIDSVATEWIINGTNEGKLKVTHFLPIEPQPNE
jgi:hypothetical protein